MANAYSVISFLLEITRFGRGNPLLLISLFSVSSLIGQYGQQTNDQVPRVSEPHQAAAQSPLVLLRWGEELLGPPVCPLVPLVIIWVQRDQRAWVAQEQKPFGWDIQQNCVWKHVL